LAAEAAREGHDLVVAVGGDGTINEVINGLGDVPGGIEGTRLGVLPLGTMNVLARELRLPMRLDRAWEVIRRGRESRIDLPCIEYQEAGGRGRRHFVQLAGAGLDARAIELVSWSVKKRIGAFGYVLAGFQAVAEDQSQIRAVGGGQNVTGELVVVGNGRLYGGPFRVFPQADHRDGLLEVCVFPRVTWMTLFRCGVPLLLRSTIPRASIRSFRTESLELSSARRTPVQIDGETVGELPATFSVQRARLRVIVP
jgi:YegS/Rv2252/BmrU family lipid kinase